MRSPRIDIASIRREQIVDAAVTVIAEQGLQNLSLSEIEKKVGMSRGQLMYYFKAKEDILLAVFDRLLQLMHEQGKAKCQGKDFSELSWLAVLRIILERVLAHPPANPEFHALQYTFLSQIGHRADFRERLAKLYEDWRGRASEHLGKELAERPGRRKVSPRAMATLMQALLHGLAMQAAADPAAFDADEIKTLCLDLFGTYLWGEPTPDEVIHARDE